VHSRTRAVMILVLMWACCNSASAQLTLQDKAELFSSPTPNGGAWSSQYSPWVLREAGWSSHVMFYCKNTVLNGVQADRIFRAESWTGGLGAFINDAPVMDGSGNPTNPHYLSCSPGVAVDGTGKWHMFFVGSPQSMTPLTLLYATSTNYGWTWSTPVVISAIPAQQYPQGYIETPSPVYLSSTNQIIVYYLYGSSHALYNTQMNQTNQQFSSPVKVTAPSKVSHGHVTYAGGKYYYAYSACAGCADVTSPPNALYLSGPYSTDSFATGTQVSVPTLPGWDSVHKWSPHLIVDGSVLRFYYAGNAVNPPAFWGGYGSIGVASGTGPCPAVSLAGPTSKTILVGQSATLSVSASSSGSSIVSYQWYKGASGSTSQPITGATGASYNTGVLTSSQSYWVKVTNACGGSANSTTATVIVNAPARYTFRSYYSKYLTATGGGGAGVDAVSITASSFQRWNVVDLNGGLLTSGDQVQLRTDNGVYYMVAEGCGGAAVNANRTSAGYWETFTIRKINPSTYALMSGSILSGDSAVLQTNPACGLGTYYVVAVGGGGGAVTAASTTPREWETFAIVGTN